MTAWNSGDVDRLVIALESIAATLAKLAKPAKEVPHNPISDGGAHYGGEIVCEHVWDGPNIDTAGTHWICGKCGLVGACRI